MATVLEPRRRLHFSRLFSPCKQDGLIEAGRRRPGARRSIMPIVAYPAQQLLGLIDRLLDCAQ